MLTTFWLILLITAAAYTPDLGAFTQAAESKDKGELQRATLVEDPSLILISTIDGVITAVDVRSGVERWKFKEAPILESPVSVQQGFTFISNPRDGQLYFVVEGQLTKLPFTIPQLVKVSPCRSTDGILYAGNKKDVWISLDPETGHRSEPLSAATVGSYCPVNSPNAIFVGKTEYRISMVDTNKRNRQWNATFVDYSSHLLPEESKDTYPFLHLTSSSDGRMVTMDAATGKVLWRREFKNVIVNIYSLRTDGMHKLPSTAIGRETFETLNERTTAAMRIAIGQLNGGEADSFSAMKHSNQFQPALFVGESEVAGLYAIPAYVDDETITIAPKYIGPPLIEGKMPVEEINRPMVTVETHGSSPSTYKTVEVDYLLLGYHEPPPEVAKQLIIATPYDSIFQKRQERLTYVEQKNEKVIPHSVARVNYRSENESGEWPLEHLLQQLRWNYPAAFYSVLFLILTLGFTVVWMCGRQNGLALSIRHLHRSSSEMPSISSISSSRSSGRSSAAGSERRTWSLFGTADEADPSIEFDPEDRWVRVGKLHYDPKAILGRGCEGTVVFRGRFDGREVAVKRVVSDFIEIIDREVNHLRESDNHSNVIRYFCSEADRTFRYIALELCDCNLEDYVRSTELQKSSRLDKLEILRQASDGIAHLHGIKIVHRDVKPKNILLSIDAMTGRGRVLISDFGLCKKIKHGHNSISRMSGMAGTEGWMAPEVIEETSSITCAVDVFSLGCIFYYVLSGGDHPFGEIIRRQDNILRGHYNIQEIHNKRDFMSAALIEAMLEPKASRRPSATAVALHPMFWSKERQLQFLLDVSDRIENEDNASLPVQRLEQKNKSVFVIGSNWRDLVSEPLHKNLQQYRSYKGTSVKDLLRALRNKKHHYRELPEELKQSLGAIPDEYLTYFTSRFPRLLIHSYVAMTICANESNFATYYPPDLKAFYERILAEETEKYPFTTATTTQVPIGQHKHFASTGCLGEGDYIFGASANVASEADKVSNWRKGLRRSNSPMPATTDPLPVGQDSPKEEVDPHGEPPLPTSPTLLPATASSVPTATTPKAKKTRDKKRRKKPTFPSIVDQEADAAEEGEDVENSPQPSGGEATNST